MSVEFSVCLNVYFQCLRKIWTKPFFPTSADLGLAKKQAALSIGREKINSCQGPYLERNFFLVAQSQTQKCEQKLVG